MKLRQCYIVIVLSAFSILSCKEDKDVTEPGVKAFELSVPSHFDPLPSVESNPFSKEKIELGRLLFYDPVLSGNNQISCAGCHRQNLAFTDGEALSDKGVSGNQLLRHSPALINLAWMQGLFWEGGAKNLESLALGPISHPDEMDQNVSELVDELNAIERYRTKFREAFGVDKIELIHILQSLAQFQRTLISGNSRYDKYILGIDGGELNDLELKGLQVFEENCSSCHKPPLFTDNSYHNNGLDSAWNDISHEYIFTGRFRITFDSADLGKFKTPTLRNMDLTAPYMHDGRFSTLDEVLEHYNSNVSFSPSLDPELIKGDGKYGIELNEQEREALKAFISTLTDPEFLSNPDFSNPD